MSLFGMMGDLEDDPIFGHHMRSMRQMNNMMNSLFTDPFGMFGGGAGGMESIIGPSLMGPRAGGALMPFMGGPSLGMNRLLNGNGDGTSFCSSSVFSMTSGPNGPQVYQATSSTRTGPGGLKETRKTVQDSRSGTKKMAIGHHIGERAHIIEREQNVRTGEQEERQDYINLDDEEAEEFDREFQTKARSSMSLSGGRRSGPEIMELPSNQPNPSHIRAITNSPHNVSIMGAGGSSSSSNGGSSPGQQHQHSPANRNRITGGPSVTPRRAIRSPASSPLALPLASSANSGHFTTSVHPHPYSMAGRKNRAIKGPSSSSSVSAAPSTSSPYQNNQQ